VIIYNSGRERKWIIINESLPLLRIDYSLNLSILLREGKEINRDFLSKGD